MWLGKAHFGMATSPDPPELLADQWELAMRKADRDLRLADGTKDMPDWLRSVLGIGSVPDVVESRIEDFEQLLEARPHVTASTPEARRAAHNGLYSLGLLMAYGQDAEIANGHFRALGLRRPPSPERILDRVQRGEEYWWDLAYLQSLDIPEVRAVESMVQARTRNLVSHTMAIRGLIVSLTLGGLVYVPWTILAFLRAGRSRGPIRYSHRWTLSFGVGIFLIAYLASLGFTMAFNQSLEVIAGHWSGRESGPLLPMPLYVLLDSLTRLLPALIALAMLFRKFRHAFQQLNLIGPIDGRMVLGSFALLQVFYVGLLVAFGGDFSTHPSDALNTVETGAWGLLLAVFSGCVAAPLAEEVLFRGVLFRSIYNRFTLRAAVIVSSMIFAAVHFQTLPSLMMIGALGALCACCYAAKGSLMTAVVLHALYNAAIKIPEWIVYQVPMT